MCISVDLPEPDGPVTATNSPASTSRFAPRSARTVTSPTWYVLKRSRIEITGISCSLPSAAAAATAAAGTARSSALRSEQRVVGVISAWCRRSGVDDDVGDDLIAFFQRRIRVDDFDVRAVRDPEAQSNLLQLLVVPEPRLAARFNGRQRPEQRINGRCCASHGRCVGDAPRSIRAGSLCTLRRGWCGIADAVHPAASAALTTLTTGTCSPVLIPAAAAAESALCLALRHALLVRSAFLRGHRRHPLFDSLAAFL